jgi:acetyl esterase/lipase
MMKLEPAPFAGRTLLLVLTGIVAWFGFPGKVVLAQAKPEFTRTEDVIYGRKFGLALTFDVFRPATPNGCGLMFIVDGGWVSNHDPTGPNMPAVNPGAYKALLGHGYTVFAVVLSSQPMFTIPDIIPDLHRAVRFIRYNAAKYGVHPEHLGIIGISSGGHLALMIATQGGRGSAAAKDPVDRESSSVQAVACFFPPTDFLNWGAPGVDGVGQGSMAPLQVAFGPRSHTAEGRHLLGKEISPIYFVTSHLPPTLIIHGDADEVVPVQQSEIFVKRAQAVGAPCVRLIVREGKGHGWQGFWESKEDIGLVLDWFDQHLRGIGSPEH